jgi:hypothetical protein
MSRDPKDRQPSWWQLLPRGYSYVQSQRLTASIEEFEADLDYRLERHPELRRQPAWEKTIRERIELVRKHHESGEVDTAWRCLVSADRLRLDVADKSELQRHAKALGAEAKAGKLASKWRSETITGLLKDAHLDGAADDQLEDARALVAAATYLRDEDANNRYYKVALVRGQRSLLVVILMFCIALILALSFAVDWDTDLGDPEVGFVALVATFGALGACLSAIQSLGQVGAHGRIPEHVASSIITITRPALGAAAALGVYAIAVSGVLNIDFDNEEQAHLTVLALAFASGFSERLVVRAVGAATGDAEDGKKQ